MAAVSVVRKLQRCERIHGRRDDLPPVVKYKIKIKEGVSCSNSISINSNCASLPAAATKALAELTETLVYVSPAVPILQETSHQSSSYFHLLGDDVLQHSITPQLLLMSDSSLQGLAADFYSSKLGITTPGRLLQEAQQTEPGAAAKGSSPWKRLIGKADDNIEDEEEDEEEGMWEMFPWKLEAKDVEEDDHEVGSTGKLQPPGGKSEAEREEEVAAAWEAALQEKKQGKRGDNEEWGVKNMECECCAMEEECTQAYEERVRGELGGHWLCGLCEEAVWEEQKRLGGRLAGGEVSLQMALQAHMQPCRGFSSRARAKACPPPSDVAVPHAVCRLLRRHLSTPSPTPRERSSPAAGLPRSASCLPTFSSHRPPQP